MERQVAKQETSPTDLLDLRAFCLVVDLGSITAAAKTLGETKGSVSRRLSRLERGLGVELLRRSPRLVQATEDGAAYRMRVGRVIELLDQANAEVQHALQVVSGHLRVTAPFDLGVNIFAPLLAGFVERFPEVSVELLLTEAFLDFDAHQIDIALRATAALPDSSLIAHSLESLTGGLFAAPSYLERRGVPRRVEELSAHRLLLSRATRGNATLSLRRKDDGRELKQRVRVAIAGSDFAFCREAALAGGGIALLPDIVVRRDLQEKRLVRVLGEYVLLEATLYLLHPGSRLLPPKMRAFRDYMLDAFRRRRPRH